MSAYKERRFIHLHQNHNGILYVFSKTIQECKNSSYQVPDLKSVKKLTAKLTAGKVKEPSASLSPLTLDVSVQVTEVSYWI